MDKVKKLYNKKNINLKTRGYCIYCKRRCQHKVEGQFVCKFCDTNMGLEEKISDDDKQKLKLLEGLSVSEIQAITSQKKINNNRVYDNPKTGHIRIGIISDTHIGHEKFDEELFKYSGKIFRQEKVQGIYHAGDILEGMSGREGNVYEMSQIGFANQIAYAEKLISEYYKGLKVFAINGNHDLWFKIKNNAGVNVAEELQRRLPKQFVYLGDMEADVKFADNCVMKLFHANDGTAYASSYKLQKLIESLEGGSKPQIILSGHYHKALTMFNRNVYGIEAGTLCGQSGFMRGKKLAAHKGFYILDFDITKKGISKFTTTFYPAYD